MIEVFTIVGVTKENVVEVLMTLTSRTLAAAIANDYAVTHARYERVEIFVTTLDSTRQWSEQSHHTQA